jgi:translocation and assembly module TamA
MSATVRKYQKLNDDTVIAARGKIGSIQGATLADVPADERFYVGGSGSVRGFSYQSIGPQRAGDPTGGRGMVEGSVELRHKFTEDIGGVAFVDAGSLTEESAPDFSGTSVGAGLGLRYYTAVGPIRFDVATPLTNDDQTADKVQFYISLGQAF